MAGILVALSSGLAAPATKAGLCRPSSLQQAPACWAAAGLGAAARCSGRLGLAAVSEAMPVPDAVFAIDSGDAVGRPGLRAQTFH